MIVRTSHPVVEAKVRAVLDVLERDSRRGVFVCQHIKRDGVALVCAEHPRGGLRCPECMLDHAGRHSWELEHRCDGCGRAVDDEAWAGVMAPALTHSLKVRRPRGEQGLLVGSIVVGCLGLCAECEASSREVDS